MAGRTIHNIAVTMSADTGNAIGQFENVGKAIFRLQRVQQELIKGGQFSIEVDREIRALKKKQAALLQTTAATKQLVKANNQLTRGSGRMQQAFGQAAFAVEDFATVFGTMGFAGGMRAAGNNLSLIGHILGGPLIGGLVGVSALLLGSGLDAWLKTEEATDNAAESLKKYLDVLDRLQERKGAEQEQKLKLAEIEDLEGVDAIKAQFEKAKQEAIKLQTEIDNLNQRENFTQRKLTKNLFGGIFEEVADEFANFLSPGSPLMNNLRVINQRFSEALRIDPENMDQAFEQYRISIDDLMSDVKRLGDFPGAPGVGGQAVSAVKLISMKRTLLSVLDEIESNENDIAAAAKEINSITDDRTKKEQELNALQEQGIALRKKAMEEITKEQEKREEEAQEAFDKFNQMGRSAEEQVINNLKNKINEIAATIAELGAEAGSPLSDAAFDAQQRIVQQKIDDLQEDPEKPIPSKGEAILGQVLREQAAEARRSAEAQIAAAANQKEDVKRKDLLKVLEQMLADMQKSKPIAHQVGR